MSAASDPAPQEVWETLSQAERDAAYNNNAAVQDSAAWVTARDLAAAKFRAAANAHLDIPYGEGARQKLDLYPGRPGAPCLVFIHGGYWQRNTREAFVHYAQGLLAHGWSVALPGYTLAPEARLGEIVAEIGAALDLLARDGARHGITGPLVVSGWSAGAQLAVMQLDHPAVAAGLAVSGVYELAPIRDTFLNGALDLSDAEITEFSPLRLHPSPKPLAIAYGTDELPALVHDSRALAAQRVAAHAPGALLPIAGANHFSILDELRRPDGQLVRTALDLMPGAVA
ncbi:alpha/beta hydrolase [Xanthobacter autotrophicus]|uniref:alpha/beta hydrolase n=1 Tax=Xanthobacter autotrophicus TaxID=280 RepID=UPI0024A69398|nr:alpha/beta hydrolase [Xanthobacter autotrophicus]MDI4656805.1 alpha/beta hydrolase [Xanthobacter autotrophicus]